MILTPNFVARLDIFHCSSLAVSYDEHLFSTDLG